MTGELRPPGRPLAEHNRRVLSARLNWPAGVLEVCEAVDADHPAWYTDWSPGGSRSRPDPGFYTQLYRGDGGRTDVLYGADEAAVRAAIRSASARSGPVRGRPAVVDLEHAPRRPGWDCVAHDQAVPWPCEPARRQLVAQHAASVLAAMMWTVAEDFAHDQPQTTAKQMFRRFITWTR